MKSILRLTATLCVLSCVHVHVQAQDMDKQLPDLADKLADLVKEHNSKKVAVIDFTDLQGASSELGRYVAEQINVDLVIAKQGFSVLDRANLNKLLAEHKLTSTGLVDPDNAKKLGMFAGVDAIIIGTITARDLDVSLTAKIITTETAEIIGAAKATFKRDKTVEDLLAHPTTGGNAALGGGIQDEKPKVAKTFGDVRVELQTLRIVNGKEFLLTMLITNQNQQRSAWTALRADPDPYFPQVKGKITDSEGTEFKAINESATGIPVGGFRVNGYMRVGATPKTFGPATEIKPHEAINATLKFRTGAGKAPDVGVYRLQLEFFIGHEQDDRLPVNNIGGNLMTQIEAK